VRDELYGFLYYWAGAVVVFVAFLLVALSLVALSYFPGPDWFWSLVGFAWYFWMCFLIHEKFDSSRI
jgi:hypothetical protein